MRVLILSPFNSGYDAEPEAFATNLKRMEDKSLPLFRCGHVPMIVEWVAIPVWRAEGGERLGDSHYEDVFEATFRRLLGMCDGVLLLSGRMKFEEIVMNAIKKQGKPIYQDLGDVPGCAEYGPAMAR